MDYKMLADEFIDNMCDTEGIRETIAFIIDRTDFGEEELLELNFDKDDIDNVIAERRGE